MARPLEGKSSLTIEANVLPCAHICRYCCIGDRGGPQFPFDRWLRFTDRLVVWGQETGLRIHPGFFPSYNFDVQTFVATKEWWERRMGGKFHWISLGGLKMRSDDEMRRWLTELQQHGLEGLSATFVGHGDVHDRWNGRRGDFDFMMRTIRLALELGLEFLNQHVLIKSSLPIMLELFDELEAWTPTS